MSTTKYEKRGKKMKNLDIRQEVKESGLFLWQIADKLNISDNWLSRLLRHELSDEKKSEIRSAIKELKEGER